MDVVTSTLCEVRLADPLRSHTVRYTTVPAHVQYSIGNNRFALPHHYIDPSHKFSQ